MLWLQLEPGPRGPGPREDPGFLGPPSQNTQKRTVSVWKPDVQNQGVGRAGSSRGLRGVCSRPSPHFWRLAGHLWAPSPSSASVFARCLPACPASPWTKAPLLQDDPILTAHICGNPNSR